MKPHNCILFSTLCCTNKHRFRYAQCQLDYLGAQRTGRSILTALEHMPDDLNGIYQTILIFIPKPDRDLVRKSLLWLCFAIQPLTLAALSDAVVLEEGDNVLDGEIRLPNPSVIVEMCRGLIVYDKETDEVALAHSTVRAFLIDKSHVDEPLQ